MTHTIFIVSSDPDTYPGELPRLSPCTHYDDTNVRYPLFSFFGSQYSCGDIGYLEGVIDGESADTAGDTQRRLNLACGLRPQVQLLLSLKLTLFFFSSFFFALNSNFTMALSFIGYVLPTYLAYCR